MLAGVLQPAVRGARVQIYRGRTPMSPPPASARTVASARGCSCRSPGAVPRPFRQRALAGPNARAPSADPGRPAAAALVGSTLTLRPRLVPARAGSLSRPRLPRRPARSQPGGRLPTGRPGSLRVELRLRRARAIRACAEGGRGAGRPALARPRLARPERPRARTQARRAPLRAPGRRRLLRPDTFEAVIAFQKVNGLPRTGRVERGSGAGSHAQAFPCAARRRLHRGRQDTPGADRRARRHRDEGRPRLDRRDRQHAARQLARLSQGRRLGLGALVPDVLHGRLRDPRLPVRARYPASHGCVRVPMWIAPTLFGPHGYGTTVVVHL